MVSLTLSLLVGFCACRHVQANFPAGSAALETIRALDTDGSGKVERAEVEAFAKSQGLSAAEVKAEFADLDKNGNGDLEADELTATLQSSSDANHVQAKQQMGSAHNTSQQKLITEHTPNSNYTRSLRNHASKSSGVDVKVNIADLEIKEMEKDALIQARRTLAQVFAEHAQGVLLQRNEDEKGAETLENFARSLRANASRLVTGAAQKTEHAAQRASVLAAEKKLEEAKQLDKSALKAAVEAKKRRREAALAMRSALTAQNEMTSWLRHLRVGA